MKKKDHHYITESYQRGFSDSNGHVWILTPGGKIYNTNPENSFKESHFYTVTFKTKGGSLIVENTLAKIESAFIGVLNNKINKQIILDEKDRAHISTFIAGMLTRTKVQRNHFKKNYETMIERMEEMKKVMQKNPSSKYFQIEKGSGPSISLDELKEYMHEFDSHQSMSVLNNTLDIAPIIFNMSWSILISSDNRSFISSDNPFCMCSPEREQEYGRKSFGASAGLEHSDVELTFPLSAKYALFASWNNILPEYVDVPVYTINQINYRTCRSAQNIFANNKDILEQIIEVSKTNKTSNNIEK